MNMISTNQPVTMSSREIADLTDKRHDNVMRVCRDLKASGVTPQIEETPFSHNGNTYIEFRLSKRDSLVLVARLSPEFTAKVVDRWMELEDQAGTSLFLIPKTLPDALRLAADLADKVEEQKALIVTLGPKADFHDAVADSINGEDFKAVAKILGTGRTRFMAWLRERGYLMTSNLPYQRFTDACYFKVVQRTRTDFQTGEKFIYPKTLVTGPGLIYLRKKWIEDHGPIHELTDADQQATLPLEGETA